MTTHGSRFSGGYQFPATDSVSYTREPALKEERHRDAILRIVPLSGGRPLFEVHAVWTEIKEVAGQVGPTEITWPYYAKSEVEARELFAHMAAGFDSGDFPAGLP